MTIKNVKDYYNMLEKLQQENRITEEEYKAFDGYLCGIFDALSVLGIKEEDFTMKNIDSYTDNEPIKIWLEELGDPTIEEIKSEIEEVKGTISNEKLWALSDDIHYENIEVLEEYLEVLTEILEEKENKI